MADHADEFVIQEVTAPEQLAPNESEAVKALSEEYAEAREFDSYIRKQYQEDRGYASGSKLQNWASDANLIGSFIDILVSFLYARDPDVSSRAAPQVGGVNEDNANFAETAGIIVPCLWRKAKLKRAARKQVRSALTVGVGWLKVIMTHETRRDPLVQKELNDLENNLEELQAAQLAVTEGDMDDQATKAEIARIQTLQESLQQRLEVVHRYGIAVDFVNAEDMQVSLDVDDITEHLSADWNSNEMFMRVSQLRGKFPRLTADDVKMATVYNQRKPRRRNDDGSRMDDAPRYSKDTGQGSGSAVEFARVVELWDRRDNHVKTFVEGIQKWAIEPYQPPYWSSRFYPYFQLALFLVDGERHPQSLAYRLKKLQDEYSSKRSNSRLAAERSVPGTIFDSTGLTPEDASKIEKSVSMEMIGIKNVKGDDIRKLFAAKPVPSVDPAVFDTRPTVADMERVAGVQEALSAAITVQKTATEAKIQDTGFASRSGADRDTLEDVLTDLGVYTTELAIQGMPAEYVTRIAGPLSFWPAGMDPDDVVTLVELEIRAGSTGKPNSDAERQAWSVVLPLVQQMMVAVQNAQFMGNLPLATAYVNLLKETFRRLDERIDITQFIPQGLPNLQGVPGMPGGDVGGAAPEEQPDTGPTTAADANTLV